MRGFGVSVLIIGALILTGGLFIDTSVATTVGRIVNLSLQSQQMIVVLIGLVTGLSGVIFVATGEIVVTLERVAAASSPQIAEPAATAVIQDLPRTGERVSHPVHGAGLLDAVAADGRAWVTFDEGGETKVPYSSLAREQAA